MNSPLSILQSYADAFRELVNARVWRTNESPEKALRLNAPSDWEFICVAMDVVEDAALALESFLRFSLKTFFRGQDNRIAEIKKKLEDLRFIRDGNVIIHSGRNATNPAEIRIVFVTPQKTPDKASRHARRKDRGNTLPHDR